MTDFTISGVTIRPCSPDDRDAIMALIAICETEEMGSPDPAMLDGVSIVWQRSDFDWGKNAWLAAASDGGQALGYAHLQPVERTDLQAFAGVFPDARGHGIGTALLALIERRACEAMGRFAPDVSLANADEGRQLANQKTGPSDPPVPPKVFR